MYLWRGVCVCVRARVCRPVADIRYLPQLVFFFWDRVSIMQLWMSSSGTCYVDRAGLEFTENLLPLLELKVYDATTDGLLSCFMRQSLLLDLGKLGQWALGTDSHFPPSSGIPNMALCTWGKFSVPAYLMLRWQVQAKPGWDKFLGEALELLDTLIYQPGARASLNGGR